MKIPRYDDIMHPCMNYIINNGVKKARELESPLAEIMELDTELLEKGYTSGNGKIFLDRISWSLCYLLVAGILERPKRAHYQATELANEFINKPDELKALVKKCSAEHLARRLNEKQISQNDEVTVSYTDSTPQEALELAYSNIRNTTYENILDTILSKSPSEFERLVVMLLDKMGYGGQVKDAGQITQASNDGGIDGIIKEDILGLGRIHIQAKKYARKNSVGRDEIQKFVGALAVAQSNKGVFITTSYYTAGGKEYADSLNGNTNLVLIDGLQLAEYIYEFSLGLHTEQVIEIKRLDADFWDEMQDDKNKQT